MQPLTRHRLLGAATLIAIIILLLPFLQGRHDGRQRIEKLLEKPHFPAAQSQVMADSINLVDLVQHEKGLANNYLEKDLALAVSKPNIEELNTQPLPPALGKLSARQVNYVLQIASFRQKQYALQLVNFLRNLHYPAFLYQSHAHTRVYLGGWQNLQVAHHFATVFEQDTHLRGIIVQYQPLEV